MRGNLSGNDFVTCILTLKKRRFVAIYFIGYQVNVKIFVRKVTYHEAYSHRDPEIN